LRVGVAVGVGRHRGESTGPQRVVGPPRQHCLPGRLLDRPAQLVVFARYRDTAGVGGREGISDIIECRRRGAGVRVGGGRVTAEQVVVLRPLRADRVGHLYHAAGRVVAVVRHCRVTAGDRPAINYRGFTIGQQCGGIAAGVADRGRCGPAFRWQGRDLVPAVHGSGAALFCQPLVSDRLDLPSGPVVAGNGAGIDRRIRGNHQAGRRAAEGVPGVVRPHYLTVGIIDVVGDHPATAVG